MKKAYSLNYDIYSTYDRIDAIAEILDELPQTPNHTDLEQMADYILYGKDDQNLSVVDTKEILQPKRRYSSFQTKAEETESLDTLLEDPVVAQDIENNAKPVSPENKSPYKVFKQEIRRTKYDENGNILEYGDDFDNEGNEIPFMRELWKSIDRISLHYDMYRGKIPPDEWVRAHPITKYQLYKMQHLLIDLRRQQYYIKDSYNPTLHFFNIAPPTKGPVDFESNTGLWLEEEEWCARKRNPQSYDMEQPSYEEAERDETSKMYWKISDNKLNYENYEHIIALLDNYVSLLKHSYPHPDSTTRMICWDLERLIENTKLTDLETFLLRQRVAHRSIALIQKVLIEEGFCLSDQQVSNLMKKVIPQKIAKTATILRIQSDAETKKIPLQRCTCCGQLKPLHELYYGRNKATKTGYCVQCKVCQKIRRQRKEANRKKQEETQ